MSVTFPINLSLVDTNGDGKVDAAQLDQTTADSLYSYYISKLTTDSTALTEIANALVATADAFDALYNAIKQKLLSDTLVVQVQEKVPVPTVVNADYQGVINQIMSLVTALMPLQLLTAFANSGNTTERLISELLPLLIIVPLFSKLV